MAKVTLPNPGFCWGVNPQKVTTTNMADSKQRMFIAVYRLAPAVVIWVE
jgi:hypothetical protein